MIITRTPLRIPIGGGGTDLPGFYKKQGAFFISAAIDYYIYVAAKRRPMEGIRLGGYSHIEEVKNIVSIADPIIKASLKYLKVPTHRGLEIVSIGDLPAGAGLGSSGTFTVGLINALHHLEKHAKPASVLADQACHINMDILKEPSGKQDEYIAAYGGITCFEVGKNGKVKTYPLKVSYETINNLQNNMLMFYTGIVRSSGKALAKQRAQTVKDNSETFKNLEKIQEIAYKIKKALEKGNTTLFGKLIDEHWNIKRKREETSNTQIDKWYEIAKRKGAIGGKIMGAGGGGFFVFYCEDKKETLRKAMKSEGLEELRFHFDFEGSKLIVNI